MRLAHKLSVAQLVLIVAVLSVHAAIRLRRELNLFENNMRDEHHLTGQFMRAAVTDIWQLYGEDRALQLIRKANTAEQSVHISFIPASVLVSDSAEAGTAHPIRQLFHGEEVVQVDRSRRGSGDLSTYLPVWIQSRLIGAVRVSESLVPERRFLRNTVWHMVVTTTAIGLGAILISFLLGSSMIVKPMEALVAQARRVGSGDLSIRLRLKAEDEIGELAGEMNLMCDRLKDALARIRSETRARITALEQLRHADRLATVGSLASGIAHELGTPLGVVSGRAKMIESGAASGEEASRCARIVREQAAGDSGDVPANVLFDRLEGRTENNDRSHGSISCRSVRVRGAPPGSCAREFHPPDPAGGALRQDPSGRGRSGDE